MVETRKLIVIIARVMNTLDSRLVERAVKVIRVIEDLLKAEGSDDPTLRKNLKMIALLHDIGAYRADEPGFFGDKGRMWEHAVYSYLFLREFTPLGPWAEIALYHHADCDQMPHVPENIRHYAQLLYLADYVVRMHSDLRCTDDELRAMLESSRGSVIQSESVDLFLRADAEHYTLRRLNEPPDLDKLMEGSILTAEEAQLYLKMIMHMIDFRSSSTVTHTLRVMELGKALGKRMGLPDKTLEQIYFGGLLHDLGKIGIPEHILEKPSRLTDEETHLMRRHVELTAELIDGCIDQTVANIASRHHEKLDGTGYPLGLAGDQLTLPERILAVADIASALCMSRCYKIAYPKENCLNIMDAMVQRGKIDAQVVQVLADHYDELMDESDAACEPTIRIYDRIQEEYQILVQHAASSRPDAEA